MRLPFSPTQTAVGVGLLVVLVLLVLIVILIRRARAKARRRARTEAALGAPNRSATLPAPAPPTVRAAPPRYPPGAQGLASQPSPQVERTPTEPIPTAQPAPATLADRPPGDAERNGAGADRSGQRQEDAPSSPDDHTGEPQPADPSADVAAAGQDAEGRAEGGATERRVGEPAGEHEPTGPAEEPASRSGSPAESEPADRPGGIDRSAPDEQPGPAARAQLGAEPEPDPSEPDAQARPAATTPTTPTAALAEPTGATEKADATDRAATDKGEPADNDEPSEMDEPADRDEPAAVHPLAPTDDAEPAARASVGRFGSVRRETAESSVLASADIVRRRDAVSAVPRNAIAVADAKDRLLRVLLTDPDRALHAVGDLEECRRRLDRLRESVHQERRMLADAARRLRGAGLTAAQVARLAGIGEGELVSLLAEHAPSPTPRVSQPGPPAAEPTDAPEAG